MSFFKEIPQILSEFSKTQKLMALILLLFTIIIITISPSIISTITLDRKDLENKIENKQGEVDNLKILLEELDSTIRTNQKNCTNEIVKRENEFLLMLKEIKREAINNEKANNLVLEKFQYNEPILDSVVFLPQVPQVPRVEKKSTVIPKIEECEKKIKAQK